MFVDLWKPHLAKASISLGLSGYMSNVGWESSKLVAGGGMKGLIVK